MGLSSVQQLPFHLTSSSICQHSSCVSWSLVSFWSVSPSFSQIFPEINQCNEQKQLSLSSNRRLDVLSHSKDGESQRKARQQAGVNSKCYNHFQGPSVPAFYVLSLVLMLYGELSQHRCLGMGALPCARGRCDGFPALSWGTRAVLCWAESPSGEAFPPVRGSTGHWDPSTGRVPGQGVESSLTGKKRGISAISFYGQVTLRVKALSVNKNLCFVFHATPPAGTFLSSQHHEGWQSITGLCSHKSTCYQSKRRFLGRAQGAPCQKPGQGIASHSRFFLSLFWDGQ